MTTEHFLAGIYAWFDSTGEWPTVHYLQRQLGTQQNVRALAAEIGQELVLCQEGADRSLQSLR